MFLFTYTTIPSKPSSEINVLLAINFYYVNNQYAAGIRGSYFILRHTELIIKIDLIDMNSKIINKNALELVMLYLKKPFQLSSVMLCLFCPWW